MLNHLEDKFNSSVKLVSNEVEKNVTYGERCSITIFFSIDRVLA